MFKIYAQIQKTNLNILKFQISGYHPGKNVSYSTSQLCMYFHCKNQATACSDSTYIKYLDFMPMGNLPVTDLKRVILGY